MRTAPGWLPQGDDRHRQADVRGQEQPRQRLAAGRGPGDTQHSGPRGDHSAGQAPAAQQFNSPQRLQAIWRELRLPGPVAGAVASLGGPVLVIDDRIDSGWTMTVAARLLREAGAPRVLPLVLASTTG